MFKHYGSSYIFTAIAMVLGYLIGGWNGVWIVSILGVIETSLSFDNAVVNASVLKSWDPVWRKRFMVWGLPVAVFGMRLVFPLTIVAIAASVGPIDALMLAVQDPKQYESILMSVRHEIAAFGGAFLFMVFLKFFFDQEKDVHWVNFIEAPLNKLGRLQGVEIGLTLVALLITAAYIDSAEKTAFLIAGVWGILTYMLADTVGMLVAGGEDSGATGVVVKAGVGGFIYLELLDASFSFDGVIAAFAITNNVFLMMIGLAVGAMFVRSMTLHLVETNTLAQFRYLESAAFWAIGALAVIMFAGTSIHISEMVTGLIGAALIAAGLFHSHIENRRELAAA